MTVAATKHLDARSEISCVAGSMQGIRNAGAHFMIGPPESGQHGEAAQFKRLTMSKALLLIDFQNDYFSGGAMELAGSMHASQQARRLLNSFRHRSLPVIHVQHITNRSGTTFFLPNTAGVEINESVKPVAGEKLIQKHSPNSFRGTPLLDHLDRNNITQLFIAGMMTHLCVDTTIRAAADLGFECLLAHDACATKSLSFGGVTVMAASVQTTTLAALNGLFARVAAAEELCAVI